MNRRHILRTAILAPLSALPLSSYSNPDGTLKKAVSVQKNSCTVPEWHDIHYNGEIVWRNIEGGAPSNQEVNEIWKSLRVSQLTP